MTTSFAELDPNQAKTAGFAVFNSNGRHVCLDLAQEAVTISVKTADDELVTFAFNQRSSGEGHGSIDIVHHGERKNADGNPLQRALFLGQGPTNARTHPDDNSPTTIVVLQL